ncbi:hypothetical protein SEUBUCD646_0K02260 [Saccharomyces eubayanus]|uniref:YKR005C-like protein n=1 Tax=Saccharomyces eubayanus TaxID=1080349 RepID=A0ABN8VGI6_SACEU|nr:hypothetical protein SEUBUCD650_0K02250 [Saccharomyces eubayanus]CAI1573721.1 hypothetical protein SEUBUCD646_0K02260 [Saccharomyces eubayanus]
MCKRPNLNKCVFHYFDEQYSFCRSCVIVNNETMEDSNNCRCVQCALSSLNNSCFQDYCTSGDEQKTLQNFIEQFKSINGVSDNGVSLKPGNNKFSSKKLTYFVDQNHTVFRNPLPFEKNQLIFAILASLTNSRNGKLSLAVVSEVENDNEYQDITETQFWGGRRRKNKKQLPKTADDEDDNDEDLVEEKHRDDKEEDGNNEKEGENCNENHGDDDDDEGRPRKPPLLYTTTEAYTSYLTKPRENPVTYSVDECKNIRTITAIVDTLYDNETETKTETETEILTRIEYKQDFFTTTETKVREITKIIGVGKVTITDYDTITETPYEIVTKTKFRKKLTKVTETSTVTQTKTAITTSTKAKRRWFPRTTTITSTTTTTFPSTTTTTTTSLLITVVNPGRLQKITGIKFGLFNVSGEAVPPPDEKNVQSIVKRNIIADSNTSTQSSIINTTTTQVPSKSELDSGQYISAASQLDKRIFIFTVITVSITTLTILGFSYRSRVSFRDHTVDESDDDDDWSDEEVELDEEDFYSLPISIPEKGLSLDKMAQQLGVE